MNGKNPNKLLKMLERKLSRLMRRPDMSFNSRLKNWLLKLLKREERWNSCSKRLKLKLLELSNKR